MKKIMFLAMAVAAVLAFSGIAQAAGALNFYNWGNYTNPEMIKKFEAKYDIKVTITDYDSNDTMMAKVKAGGHGFDMACPSANFVKIFIEEGLVLEARVDQMENFKHVAPEWRNPDWDPGRRYSAPWQWGTVGIVVDTEFYKGDSDKPIPIKNMNDVCELCPYGSKISFAFYLSKLAYLKIGSIRTYNITSCLMLVTVKEK